MSMPTISIPYRDTGEPLTDTAANARHLAEPERAVTREVIVGAQLAGDRTAADLLARVERALVAERRAMLDRARVACGLPTVSEARIASGEALLKLGPNFREMHLEHRPNGVIVECWHDEPIGIEAGQRRLAVQREARQAERRVEAASVAEHERAQREQLIREPPPHLRGHR